MIDFALAAEREEGKSPRDAIFQACLLRDFPGSNSQTASSKSCALAICSG